MDEKPTTMFIFQLLVLKIAIPLCILRSDTSAEQAPSKDSNTDEHAREEDQAPIPKTVWPGDTRDSSHISRVLHLETHRSLAQEAREAKLLKRLTNMYHTSIQPLEDLYRFRDLNKHVITDAEINAKPLILLVGPWSTGKSTMINYLLGIENPQHLMRTGAEPTTSEFTVLQHGPTYKSIEGMVLATDPTKQFSPLEKFGQGFLEKFQGLELPSRLLERVTLVDTPGIIENRKQQERGYPYNDVMRWFIDRADLVLVIFDPSKLDVGIELESLFKQLKGRESQIRLVLNKADVLSTQELMRVYGALFWNLAPLINVTEPPRVYMGSFWDKPFKPNTIHDLFLKEETSLLQDLYNTVTNHIENKITFVRQHAYLVRIHALVVDRHLTVFNAKRSIFGDAEVLLSDIIENPNKFNIYHSVLAEPYVSKYDLFPAGVYKEFFSINALNSFKVNEAHCTIMSGCVMDKLVQALVVDLPGLLSEFSQGTCEGDTCSP